MITISLRKAAKQGEWLMLVSDGNNRPIMQSGAHSPREAARWLLIRANKLADEIEEQLVELGFLSEADCEAALAEDKTV